MEYTVFKIKHSELISYFQYIEHDLKFIYAGMRKGDFEENLDTLDRANLGEIITELKKLDYSDNHPELTEGDYKLLNKIRSMRNYWCHQCYNDFSYISNASEQIKKFNNIAERLENDVNKMAALHKSIQKFRLLKLKQYKRI